LGSSGTSFTGWGKKEKEAGETEGFVIDHERCQSRKGRIGTFKECSSTPGDLHVLQERKKQDPHRGWVTKKVWRGTQCGRDNRAEKTSLKTRDEEKRQTRPNTGSGPDEITLWVLVTTGARTGAEG